MARELLEEARVARLAHLDEAAAPRVLPVTFAVCGAAIVTAIDEHKPKRGEPARVRRLRARPRAAVCVDRYDDEWDRLAWVQALGAVEVVEATAAPDALAALAARYAPYAEQPPRGPVLRLEPERLLFWRAAG